jgi:hypothetical protein
MFVRGRFIWVLLLICFCAPSLCGDNPDKDSKGIMRKKLTHAQRVLEGLVINDFDKIIDNAKELMFLTKQNEWRALDAPQFEIHSNDFRRSLESLVAKAREKNGDGTALAYVEMTLSCVRCHKHIRAVRMTRLDPGDFRGPALLSAESSPLPGIN